MPKAEIPTADQIQIALEKIAANSYSPAQPGTEWAGEGIIVDIISKEMFVTRPFAKRIVDAAVEKLWSENPDNPARVELRLAIQRLTTIRDMIYRTLTRPRRKKKFDVETKLDANNKPVMKTIVRHGKKFEVPETVKILKSVEVYHEVDAALISKYNEIEAMLAKLRGLDKAQEQGSLTRQFMEFLEQMAASDGVAVTGVNVSIAQLMKKLPVNQFSSAGKKVLSQVVDQQRDSSPPPDDSGKKQ
jgi:hypothetical protein